MTLTTPHTRKNAVTLINPVFGLGRIRRPSERAGDIMDSEAEQHRKNDYDEEMEDG
jgi:hypothetical protein